MRQFDVFENPSPTSRAYAPLVVILQSHLLMAMPTVVVAPLLPEGAEPPYTGVSVHLEVAGGRYVVSVAELSAVDARAPRTRLGQVRSSEDAIRRALERVFIGF